MSQFARLLQSLPLVAVLVSKAILQGQEPSTIVRLQVKCSSTQILNVRWQVLVSQVPGSEPLLPGCYEMWSE